MILSGCAFDAGTISPFGRQDGYDVKRVFPSVVPHKFISVRPIGISFGHGELVTEGNGLSIEP